MAELTTYILILLPAISGYITSMKCHIGKDAGSEINARPPSWVFGAVWPLLYILLGLTWVKLRRYNKFLVDILMAINTLCLVLWIIIYGCKNNKKQALYVMLLILLVALCIFGYSWSVDTVSGIMITPFVVWIMFALMLNYSQVTSIQVV